jgi:hypothetical protein
MVFILGCMYVTNHTFDRLWVQITVYFFLNTCMVMIMNWRLLDCLSRPTQPHTTTPHPHLVRQNHRRVWYTGQSMREGLKIWYRSHGFPIGDPYWWMCCISLHLQPNKNGQNNNIMNTIYCPPKIGAQDDGKTEKVWRAGGAGQRSRWHMRELLRGVISAMGLVGASSFFLWNTKSLLNSYVVPNEKH